MELRIADILPSGFDFKNLNSSNNRLKVYYNLIKQKVTFDNYKTVYRIVFEHLQNIRFKFLFAVSYKTFLINKFVGVDVAFIEKDLIKLPKPKGKGKRRRLFSKNRPLLNKGAYFTGIYTTAGKNDKPFYNLSRH